MTTLNLDESHDFDSEKYLLATQVVDLMTKQFNSKELSDVFPYFQTGGAGNETTDGTVNVKTCLTCTYVNKADAETCEMCNADLTDTDVTTKTKQQVEKEQAEKKAQATKMRAAKNKWLAIRKAGEGDDTPQVENRGDTETVDEKVAEDTTVSNQHEETQVQETAPRQVAPNSTSTSASDNTQPEVICDIFLNNNIGKANITDSGGAMKKLVKCNDIDEEKLSKLLDYSKNKLGVILDNFKDTTEFCKTYIILQIPVNSESYNLFKKELEMERNIRGSQLPILIECDRLQENINSNPNPHQNSTYIVNTNFGPSAKQYFKKEDNNKKNTMLIYNLFLIEVLKLHRKGYAHLDLKPDNFCILTDEQDNVDVSLIDFGNTLGPEKKNLNNKKFKIKGGGTFGYTTLTQSDASLNNDMIKKQDNMSMLELQKLDIFACVRTFVYLMQTLAQQSDEVKSIAKILGINNLTTEIESFKREVAPNIGEILELTSLENVKSVNLENVIKEIIRIIDNKEHRRILNDKLYESNCGAIEFKKDNINETIDKLIRKEKSLYCEQNNFTFNGKNRVKLGGGKMGAAYKTGIPEHPVCKVTPSKYLKEPREIEVADGIDTRFIRKTYPWLNQTLVGLVLMKHMGNTKNVLENTGAYYAPKKELVPSTEFHNGTGYNFMEQADGDLSQILIELTNQTGRDEENKKHFRDIVLQILYILRHLQTKCNFVHGDLKDKNVFYTVKKEQDTNKIKYGTDKEYEGQHKYIIKIADLDKSSCDYETDGKKYRFVPKARDLMGKDACGIVLNTMKTFGTMDFNKLKGGGIMNIDKMETVCLVRHMPKEVRGEHYQTLIKMGKSFDIFTIMTSLLSYKNVFDAFGEKSLSEFLKYVGKDDKDRYMNILKTKYHVNNKYGFENNPLSKLSEFFKIFKNIKIRIEMFSHLDEIIKSLEEQATKTGAEQQTTETNAQPASGAKAVAQPKAETQDNTEKHTNVEQKPYTSMYTKREAPMPPPEDGDDKKTYEDRNKAKHPKPFKETPKGKVPFEYTSYKSSKPLKKDEPNIYVENIMEELNYIEHLLTNDKIGERYISQIPMMMRELIQESNPSKEEIDKIRELIDMSANYKTKKDVDETLRFDFKGLMDNSSIALSEETFMLNGDIADNIEKFRLNELQSYQVTKNQDENVLNENQMLLEENETLKNRVVQLETLNQKPKPPEIVPPAPALPPPVPEGVNVPGQEDTRAELDDPTQGERDLKKDGYSYDGLIKKDTDSQVNLATFFKRLENKYNIIVGEQEKKQKLLEVEKMTPEEYKKYAKSIKETLRQNPEYERIFRDYKTKLNSLLELYDDYKFPKYRSLIKELKDKEKNLEFIEDELLKSIKKDLDGVADKLDAKYKPRYRDRDRDGGEDERRAIIRKKSELKTKMDKWDNEDENGNKQKYVYYFPSKPTTFKQELENAIANV
jgi:hypothetical protein